MIDILKISLIEIMKISFMTNMFCALGAKRMVFYPYQKLIKRLPWWLSWPLGRCFKCFAGQILLWYWIITKPIEYKEISYYGNLILFVFTGIFVSMVWDKLYRFLDENW